jgi:hypothetical protein
MSFGNQLILLYVLQVKAKQRTILTANVFGMKNHYLIYKLMVSNAIHLLSYHTTH